MEKGRGEGTDTLKTDKVFTRKKYIEREAAISQFEYSSSAIPEKWAQIRIEELPAADVAPVRHGRWDDKVVAFYRKCSECGCYVEWNKKPFLFGDGEYNYCPNCGARMDKDGDGDA